MPYAAAAPQYAQHAAAAARWDNGMPLGQSDGGIGYQRQRAMPRGPMPGEGNGQAAEDFFGLGGNGNGGGSSTYGCSSAKTSLPGAASTASS